MLLQAGAVKEKVEEKPATKTLDEIFQNIFKIYPEVKTAEEGGALGRYRLHNSGLEGMLIYTDGEKFYSICIEAGKITKTEINEKTFHDISWEITQRGRNWYVLREYPAALYGEVKELREKKINEVFERARENLHNMYYYTEGEVYGPYVLWDNEEGEKPLWDNEGRKNLKEEVERRTEELNLLQKNIMTKFNDLYENYKQKISSNELARDYSKLLSEVAERVKTFESQEKYLIEKYAHFTEMNELLVKISLDRMEVDRRARRERDKDDERRESLLMEADKKFFLEANTRKIEFIEKILALGMKEGANLEYKVELEDLINKIKNDDKESMMKEARVVSIYPDENTKFKIENGKVSGKFLILLKGGKELELTIDGKVDITKPYEF